MDIFSSENDLIPYEASGLPAGPWMVIAPHPDDETFGMGGTLALAARAGIKVTVVMVTSGDKGGEVSTRREEAQQAVKSLGLDDIEFWGLKDREVYRQGDLFLERFSEGLARLVPRTIFLPSPLEYHPDHRAVSLLAMKFLDDIFRRFPTVPPGKDPLVTALAECRLWLYEITRQCEANRLIKIDTVLDIKKAAIDTYKSQAATADYHDTILAINRARALTLDSRTRYAEAFLEIPVGESSLAFMLRLDNYIKPGVKILTTYPLISVIIRTYNRPGLLKEALESVASQVYPETECLVVNDGGEDIQGIIDDFTLRIRRLEYINFPTRSGRATAANEGIKHAKGKYVCFLDDDDIFYPDHLLTLYQAITEKKTLAWSTLTASREYTKTWRTRKKGGL